LRDCAASDGANRTLADARTLALALAPTLGRTMLGSVAVVRADSGRGSCGLPLSLVLEAAGATLVEAAPTERLLVEARAEGNTRTEVEMRAEARAEAEMRAALPSKRKPKPSSTASRPGARAEAVGSVALVVAAAVVAVVADGTVGMSDCMDTGPDGDTAEGSAAKMR
jgi:hypothetical protein